MQTPEEPISGFRPLWGANFFRTNLQDADLSESNLVAASLRQTVLDGANLNDCHIYGVAVFGLGVTGALGCISLPEEIPQMPKYNIIRRKPKQIGRVIPLNDERSEPRDCGLKRFHGWTHIIGKQVDELGDFEVINLNIRTIRGELSSNCSVAHRPS